MLRAMPLPRPGLLRDPDFRRLFAATAAGQLGDRIIFLALPLVAILALRVSEFQVGLLTASTVAGSLLVGLPAGAWIDRLRKRAVLINADLIRAVVLLLVPVAWWAGFLSIWLLYAVALVHGILTVFFDVAYVSYLPGLVGREHLIEGNAKLAAVRSAVSVSGPGLAGPLVALLGAPVALLASSAGMVISALFVVRIAKPETKPEPAPHPHLGREIVEGLKFVFHHRLLRPIVISDAVFSLFLILYQTMLLVFLARHLGLGSLGIGLVLSAMGCGGLLGALTAGRVAARIGRGRVIWLAPLLTCPLAALMPLTRPGWTVYAATAGLMLLSMGGVIRLIAQSGLQQSVTPARLLGRMSATARFVTWGSMPLGGLAGGVIGALLGAGTTLWIGAAGMTLAFLPTFLSPLRTMRDLPTAETP
jgi:predicted MFS family arabinose efflux permease